MSGFNINTHIKEHASFYWTNPDIFKNKNEKEEFFKKAINKKDYKHFTLSFNALDFENKKEAEETLKKIVNMLLNYELKVREKNGKTKKGKQKYCTRTITFKNQIFVIAVHVKGADNNWLVNPHIHILHAPNARFGKNYSYLKKAILNILEELGVKAKPSFASKNPSDMRISKEFKKVLQARSWAVRMGKKVKIKTAQNLEKDLIKYLNITKNIEFILKNYKMLILRGYYPFQLIKTIDNFIKNKDNLNKLLEFAKKQKIAEKEGIDNLINFYLNTKNLDTIKLYNFTYQEQLLLQVYNKFIPLTKQGFYVKIDKNNKKIEIKNTRAGIEIVDAGNEIIGAYVNNAKSLKEKVRLMLDIAEAKGWNLVDLEIQGSKEFIKEVKKQIEERLQKQIEEKQKNHLIELIKAELYSYTTEELKELAAELKNKGIEIKYTDYFPTIQNFVNSFLKLEINKLKKIKYIVINNNFVNKKLKF